MPKPSDKAVQAVVDAWKDPGLTPEHHTAVMHWLMQEWPALHEAVWVLVKEANSNK